MASNEIRNGKKLDKWIVHLIYQSQQMTAPWSQSDIFPPDWGPTKELRAYTCQTSFWLAAHRNFGIQWKKDRQQYQKQKVSINKKKVGGNK